MRLMHAGHDVSVVGEIVTPSVRRGDLILVIRGSGETEQLFAFAKRAEALDANVVRISAAAESKLADLSGDVFQVGTAAVYGEVGGMPMATVLKLSTLCFLEAVISHMIREKGIPEEEMRTRHANLE